ncbi:ser/thr phosphatase family protein [Rhizoctonia solani AG-3 Rhs1AP]|uniref:Ser/thr phosphatase family protein n=2 Tax=Rhizoctonia solani AG-3 TaxID=1086053 RepID=A0A074SGX5_9AGAM|nr:ser/thr phosphatase family protein [Rhizoctonia solani AG-3 Rhs1AP]KEP49237.1 ser/thr phosphatase family protein [Rhizoctonia solani 123E]
MNPESIRDPEIPKAKAKGPQILNILHFNDVYKMTDTKFDERNKELPIFSNKAVDPDFDHLIAFAERVKCIRSTWPKRLNAGKHLTPQGLLLFSGDLFSPSVEAVVTKGMNMVTVMNELAPDACVLGNHEFDVSQFNQLIEFCNFPWIISNVKEKILGESKVPAGLFEYRVLKRAGLTIGLIGLMSKDAWDSSLPPSREGMVADLDMVTVCKDLSKKLREEEGCDLVFALTHAESDLELARQVGAYPADCDTLVKDNKKLEDIPGVDAIFGGHNHEYYLGKGITLAHSRGLNPPNIQVNDFDTNEEYNDLLVVKSGSDFNDLSEVIIHLEDREGTCRKKLVKSIKVIRHHRPVDEYKNQEAWPESSMSEVLDRQYRNEIMINLNVSVAEASDQVQVVEKVTRKEETKIANWVADAMLNWYIYQGRDIPKNPKAPPPLFIMTGGTVRGDLTLGPGKIARHQLIQLLPYNTDLALLQVKGHDLRQALNTVLQPKSRLKKDGERFPVVSGFRVEWDSRIEDVPVSKIFLGDTDEHGVRELDDEETYPVLTNDYLAKGGAGFDVFKNLNSSGSTYVQIPMYQALLFHISGYTSIAAYSTRLTIEQMIFVR